MTNRTPQPPVDAQCAWVADRCEDYADGDMPREDAARLLAHVGSCTACREALRRAESLKRSLNALPTLRCPDRATTAVRRRMQRDRSRPRARRRRALVAAGMAILAVTLTVAAQSHLEKRQRKQAAVAQTRADVALTERKLAETQAALQARLSEVGSEVVRRAWDQPIRRTARVLRNGKLGRLVAQFQGADDSSASPSP